MIEMSLSSCSTTIAPHQVLSSIGLKLKPFRAATGPGTLVRHEHVRWVWPVKIYTRTGDEGDTGLFGGGRVPKDHPRVSAYGDVDELNSSLGLVRAVADQSFFDELLESIQRDLFAIGGHLATPDPERVRKALEKAALSADRVTEFERIMDESEQTLSALRAFVLPAGTPLAASLHLARTVCRRAERSVIHLGHEEVVPELFIVYLNRLSDLLFTLARLANQREGIPDVTW